MQRLSILASVWLLLGCAPAYAANGETVNVVIAGLVPNSAANQSAAFQALLTLHGDNTTYYFPAGTYILSNLVLKNAKQLTFYGDGPASTWQYINPPTSYVKILTCTDCTDITFRDFTIDNRHIANYGGLSFYHVTRLMVARMQFTDSLPRTSYPTDIYAVAVSGTTQLNDAITVADSLFYQQALEVDNAQHVTVQRNVFYNTKSTAAIGAFSRANGTKALDWWVEKNQIIHPARCAICFNLDPVTTINTTWRELRVFDNTIQRLVDGYNIRFGTANTSVRTTGTIFDDIITDGNTVQSIGFTPSKALVTLSTYLPLSGFTFTNTHLEDMP